MVMFLRIVHISRCFRKAATGYLRISRIREPIAIDEGRIQHTATINRDIAAAEGRLGL